MTQPSTKKLYSLLKSTRNNGLIGSSKYTHVSMGINKGQYYLSASDDEEFYKIYSEMLDQNLPVCLAEKQGDYLPLLGDIDIKISVDGSNQQTYKKRRVLYTEEELLATIKCFQDAIKSNVIGWKEESLICVVLEKKPYISDGYLKNGFHLHFPYLFLEKEKVKTVLIPRIKKNIGDAKLGSGRRLFSDHTDAPETFVDDVTSKCWLMYGSSKSEDKKPYKLTTIYNDQMEQLEPYEAFIRDQFFSRDEEPLTVTQDNVMDILPQLLSVSSIKKEVFNIKTPTDLKVPTKVYLRQKLREIDNPEMIKKNLLQAKEMLKLLKPEKADEYNSWWDIGIILFNVGQGCEEAFRLWDKWSSKSHNYDGDACLEMWNNMEKRDPTFKNTKGLGSLRWYAKHDNSKKYNEFVEAQHGLQFDEKNLSESIVNFEVMTTDAPLARLMLDLYSSEYIFSDDGWYYFNGTIWSQIKVLKDFRFKLENIAQKYKEIKKKINGVLYHDNKDNNDSGRDTNDSDDDDSSDDEEKEQVSKQMQLMLKAKFQEINRAINKLENFTSQNGILKMCEVLFYNEDFYDLLDENPLLIAFKNGVFDFETLTFRKGLQSDYLSKTLNIKYDESLTLESDEVKLLDDFLFKIFPDKSIRDYFIDQTCEAFRGGNRDKIMTVWSGTGNNGKSVTQKLFETMFGRKFAIKMSSTVLTERIQPGQPNPQISRLRKGPRWGVVDELSPKEQLIGAAINLLTGNDSLPCRDLFQKGSECQDFIPMFKLVCICNELPYIKDAVEATWNRIRVIPFEAKFVPREKCPATLEEQISRKVFLCDTEITQKDRMETLARALGWYLIQHFIVKENKRRDGTYEATIPEKVNEAKIKYQTKCDILAFFMEDTFIKTDDESDKVTFDDMFTHFKSWYASAFSGKLINLNKHEFMDMVRTKYSLPETDKCIKGYAWNRHYINDDDDDDSYGNRRLAR